MEMDGATIAIGIIVLAIFVLPFVLDYRSRKKKAAERLRTLQGIAQQHQCKVDQHVLCGEAALGLDSKKNFLFYLNQRQDILTSQHVDLAEIRACQAIKDKRAAKGAEASPLPDRVELSLLPKDKGKSETRLLLYQATYGAQVNGEIQIADEWAGLINARLASK